MPIDVTLIQLIKNKITQKELSLANQDLRKADILLLVSALKKNPHIKSLNLSGNPLDFEAIKELIYLDQLEELDLSYTSLTESDLANFENINLKKLSVDGIFLRDKGVKSIAKMKNLTDLSAEECRISNAGFQLLTRPDSPLKKLKIGKNALNSDALKNIGQNQTLTKLFLCDTMLTHEVANFIAENRTLKTLNLSNNHLGNEGAAIIAQHPSITHLNLSGNSLSGSIFSAFTGNTKIEKLILFNNRLDSEGINEFVEGTDSSLTKLNLSSNKLDDDCTEALACIGSLKELNLSSNSITEEGAKILLNLCNSPSFQKIHLGSNFIPRAMLIEFANFNKKYEQPENDEIDVQLTATKKPRING